MQKTIYVNAPMPPDLEQRARIEAARRRISRAELVRRAVAEFLQRASEGQPAQPVQGAQQWQPR